MSEQPKQTDDRSTVENRLLEFMLQLKPNGAPIACRRRLPDERNAISHKFSIVGKDGYLTVGEYEDGSLGELFLRFEKEPGDISEEEVRDLIASRNALLDSFAVAVSLLFQVGFPLEALVKKFRYTKFEPRGFTSNPEIRNATSPIDYVFAWLEKRYLKTAEEVEPVLVAPQEAELPVTAAAAAAAAAGGGSEVEFRRCPGDGKHGCGHDAHEGHCRSNAYSTSKCACTGTPL